jgi:cell division protein FtsZ
VNDFKVEESKQVAGACIKVVGVGGGGGNMINHMINEGVSGIDLIVANTDAQALDASLAPTKIQLGEKKTKGLGAGMKPEIGRESALENYEEIRSSLENADIVFIASGMGGGTGTGAAPVIAQAAKEVGALTISIITKPFAFEGRKRAKIALEGIKELKKESDSIVVIPNDKLLAIIEKSLGIKESFRIVDDVLSRAVSGISGVILSYGENDINLDFADVKTVMSHRGLALMGVGEAQGENAAPEAIKSAIESPLLDNMSINGALGVLVHFTLNPNYPLLKISEAMEEIYTNVHEDAHVIFGTTTSEDVEPDKARITLIATGFEHEEEKEQSSAKQSPKPVNTATYDDYLKQVAVNAFDERDLSSPTFIRKGKRRD